MIIATLLFVVGILLIGAGFVVLLHEINNLEQRCWSSNQRELNCEITEL